jgi:hypothetical protein
MHGEGLRFVETELRGWFHVLMQIVTVLSLAEHGWDFGSRMIGAWGRGWWSGRERDMGQAVEGFRLRQQGNGIEQGRDETVCVGQEMEILSRSRSFSDINAGSESSIDNDSVRASNTWRTDTTRADNESITVKIARIRTQLSFNSTRSNSPTSHKSGHPRYSKTTPVPPNELFESIYDGEAFISHCTGASTAA